MEVIARKDEMIPHLLAVLESAYAKPVEMLDGPQEMLPTYAAYLLAQFRETRAYQPLIALLNLENDLPYQLFGDSITEEMHNVLACVFDGDEAPLRALIENPAADEYARSSAGRRSYMVLIHAGRISAADVEHYFQDLFDHKLEREPSHVWNNLCSVSADLGFASLLPHIIKAFEGDLCDPFFDRLEHMEERITSGGDARWPRGCEPIDDVVTLKSGYRFCVVYNLVLEEGDLALLNQSAQDHAGPLARVLQALSQSKRRDLLDDLLGVMPGWTFGVAPQGLWKALFTAFGPDAFTPVYKEMLADADRNREALFCILAALNAHRKGSHDQTTSIRKHGGERVAEIL